MPAGWLDRLAALAEFRIMQGCILYYKMPKVILPPNAELVSELGRRTQRPARIMARGVDARLFSPEKRTVNDGKLRLGSVGRLRAEKNVKFFVDIERALFEAGIEDFEFLIVGEGNEREYLEENLKTGKFTGFLEGEALAEAYANMDIFVFPSETDAFGNVAQEANASGVPAIVSDKGGPKFIIRHGENGLVARNREEFIRYTIELARDRERLAAMKTAARASALSRSWESVFEAVYDAYLEAVEIGRLQAAEKRAGRRAARAHTKSNSTAAG
jgi:glycosyltransferase involved in cell wall biosynthesis